MTLNILATADLHGDATLYRALFALAAARRADAVIVAGDLLPHAIRSADALAVQRGFVTETLVPLMLAFHAAHPECAVLLIPGNDDWAAAVAALATAVPASWLQARARTVGGLTVAGYGCVPITPFSIKDFERRDMPTDRADPALFSKAFWSTADTIRQIAAADLDAQPSVAEELELLARASPTPTIYVTHAPPHASGLDLARGRRSLGSQAVRQLIEQQQPTLTLHGHIHEGPELSGKWAVQLGQTWCVNPGRDGGDLCAVLITLAAGAVVALEHTRYGALAL
jgi:uncharacterized protein